MFKRYRRLKEEKKKQSVKSTQKSIPLVIELLKIGTYIRTYVVREDN